MGGQALQMFMLRYSREAEHESDSLGVSWANRAGYASGEGAKFFHTLERISEAEGKALPTWQSSHPNPGDRAERVVQLAASAPAGTNENVGEEQFLQHIEGITLGEDPREGFAQNGVFYHPVMRFQFPVVPGWKMENQRAAVVFAEPNGRAMMGLRLAPAARARDAAEQFVQQAKIQVVNRGDTAVNGLPASVIIGQAETEQGAVGVWNAFIEHEGKVYSILGYAPAGVFTQVRPTFEATAAGFGPLQNAHALHVQPARLKLVRADRAAPLASFVPAWLPPDLSAEHVALLNQASLEDNVPQGRVLKVPDVASAPPQLPSSAATSTPAARPGQPGYPPAATYPPAGAYPPAGSTGSPYPAYPPYPPQSGQGYPNQGAGAYPAPGYPSSQPSTQPDHPAAPQPYPQGSPYPSYPYPTQPTYPQPGAPNPPQQPGNNQGYPSSGYPAGTAYPPQSYPPVNAPQFPQGSVGGTPSTGQPQPPQQNTSRPSAPVWPR
jgi:hypothetical protein